MATDLPVWLRRYPSKIWERVDDYLSGNQKVNYAFNDTKALARFQLEFRDRSLSDPFDCTTGDDICITTPDFKKVFRDKLCGKICTRNIPPFAPGVMTNGTWSKMITTQCTIEQRDFSLLPYKIKKSQVMMATDFLDIIFNENTRSDLGGILSDGTVIEKYILLTSDFEISGCERQGLSREDLNSFCEKYDHNWDCIYYCEHHDDFGINPIQQVRVWAM